MKKQLWLLLTVCLLASLCCFALAAPAAQPESALPEVGEVISGFKVKEITTVDYLSADLVLMEHEKTGAQLIYIANDDIERAFSVAFRTVGENNKGLPHVFEHTALSGSEQFPSGNLMVQMMAQTYNTYLNAATYPFTTVYPCASLSEEQLLKYVEVYMAGVLHPLLLTDERAMKREAYRYELLDADADLTVTGTVYSEMQGVMGTLDNVAMYNIKQLLYPGSHMSYETGGMPQDVLTMTYQELLDFHAKYYHPSNMLLMLYGKLDYVRFLTLLDSQYLSAYDRKEVVITDDGYEPFEGYREKVYDFPASADASPGEGLIHYGIALNGITDIDAFAGTIVANAFNMESSPLQKLAREKLPNATVEAYLDIGSTVPTFFFSAMNVTERDKEVFQEVVDEAIRQTAQDGIDQSLIDWLANANTFRLLITQESKDVGVNLAIALARSWGVSGEPLDYLKQSDYMQNLAALAADGTIDAFTGKYLPAPTQCAMAITVPKPGLLEQQNEALLEQLAQMKAAMSDEEIAALVQETADFAAWQAANEQLSLIDLVKAVDVATLPEEAAEAVVQETTLDGVRVLTSEVDVEGVVSAEVIFDADMIPFDLLHDYRFYISLLGEMPTEEHSLQELEAIAAVTVNELGFTAGSRLPKAGGYEPYVSLELRMLDSKVAQAYDLAEEILFHTDLSDMDMLRAKAGETVTMESILLNSSPDSYATFIGHAAANEDELYDYYVSSFPYLDYLKTVATMTDEELSALAQRMYHIRDLLLNRNDLILLCIGNEQGIRLNNARAMDLANKLDDTVHEAVDYSADMPTLPRSIAVVIDGTMQFNTLMLPLRETGVEMNGKLLAMRLLTFDKVYMPVLRFQNGSYSVFSGINEDTMSVLSYRDPELAKTYDVYATVGDSLRALTLTQEELDGYITSAYSSLALPVGPLTTASDALHKTLAGKYEAGQKQRRMRELKQFTVEDVAAYAELYDVLYEKGVRITLGGASMIEANKELFDLVITGVAVE